MGAGMRLSIVLALGLAVIGTAHAQTRRYDGSYVGTGQVMDGPASVCGGREPFAVRAVVAGGAFELRLRHGALVGPVDDDGGLARIAWQAGGVTERSVGRIENGAASLDYEFRWIGGTDAPCRYRYALQRRG
jgi:hypothetical protein